MYKRKLSGIFRPFQPFWYYGDKMKEDEMGGHVVHVGEKTNVHGLLVRKPAGGRPTGRTRHKWENIKMDLGEIARDSMD